MRRPLFALTAAALALGALGAPATAAGTIRMVDDDGRASVGACNGNGTARTTIQSAIDASSANDSVLVCPGTYRETLTVPASKDGLTVRSTRPWAAKVVVVAGDTDAFSQPIVEIREGANRVTIQHLSLKWRTGRVPLAGVCGGYSLLWVKGRDAQVRANRLRVFGDTLGPCSVENGILVGFGINTAGSGPAPSALVSHNLVRDTTYGGIVVSPGTSATIKRNSIRYWHLDSVRFRSAGSRSPSGPGNGFAAGVGIGVFSASASVTGNEISSGPNVQPIVSPEGNPFTPRLSDGIAIVEGDGVQVVGNTVRRTLTGIALVSTSSSLVKRNVSEDHVTGIQVLGSSNNRVSGNQVSTGSRGIHVLDQFSAGPGFPSQGNRLLNNSALFHTRNDCEDATTGTRTAGTANTWRGNVASTDDPEGICVIER